MKSAEKLFYSDPETLVFSAVATDCRTAAPDKTDKDVRYEVTLDRTAFFPEAGGQCSDVGYIGEAKVLSVTEIGSEIIHITDRPVDAEKTLICSVDPSVRIRNMQDHGGEHLISGAVKALFGFDNVGFHLGSDTVTADYNGKLDREELYRVEDLANELVFADAPIKAWFPSAKELAETEYRSKKEIDGDVRLVKMGDLDICACCAPHFTSCGKIGIIRITEFEAYKGGTRVYIKCGKDALLDYRKREQSVKNISALLSVRRGETDSAVKELYDNYNNALREIGALKDDLLMLKTEKCERSNGISFYRHSVPDMTELQTAADILSKKSELFGVAAADNNGGCVFSVISSCYDLTALSESLRSTLKAGCGGRKNIVSGKAPVSTDELKSFFLAFRDDMIYNKSDIDIRR